MRVWIGCSAVLLLASGVLACDDRTPPVQTSSEGAQTAVADRSADRSARQTAIDASRRTALVAAAERASNAVVSISTTARQEARARSPWDFFFVPERTRMVEGYGTGFVTRPTGVIVTNQHVVANAERVVVTLADGTDLPATVLGQDPLTDIAVLQVKRQGLSPVSTGRSSDLMIGEWVVALGNPYAFLLGNSEPTVTVGVVSGTNRNILPSGEQTGLYFDMIQTDASINPGNSGGPLLDAQGEVVGIATAMLPWARGIGFAIPAHTAAWVASVLIREGEVRRPFLGIAARGEDLEAAADGRRRAVRVLEVVEGAPAQAAGLAPGDLLVAANGSPVQTLDDLQRIVVLARAEEIGLEIRRGERALELAIRPRPAASREAA
jgi:serine protease Do